MHIFIPTLGRVGKLKTLEFIPDNWRKRTHLICPPDEAGDHHAYWGSVQPHPVDCKGIGNVRQWITEHLSKELQTDKVCMLDDDHQFFKRFDFHSPKLTRLNKYEMEGLLLRIENMLDEFMHVGLSYRLGNNVMKLPTQRLKW